MRAIRQMRVAIDQSRQHGQVRKIDGGGAGGNGEPAANRLDFIGADKDDLIGQSCARVGIDQAAGLDRDYLSGSGHAPEQHAK
jgi:hypothetical protein